MPLVKTSSQLLVSVIVAVMLTLVVAFSVKEIAAPPFKETAETEGVALLTVTEVVDVSAKAEFKNNKPPPKIKATKSAEIR